MIEKKHIGFIGTGVMGKSIVKHLLSSGHKVSIFTRTKEKAQDLIDMGAKWAQSPGEVASQVDVVFIMVGYPSDVEDVFYSEQGVFANGKSGLIVVDLTTSKPTLAIELYEKALTYGMSLLDAPVSGGDVGAKLGKLSIMVGGDKEVFDSITHLFKLFGEHIVYQGNAGAGQHTKMANQIAIASNMIAVCEAITYAKKAKLNPETVLQSISMGAAGSWSLSNLAPRMLKDDFEPGFYIKHFIKDMGIALDEAKTMGIQLPGLEMAYLMYQNLAEQGFENEGTQSLIKAYNK
ncbi:NAD(P)-dependent oxidoreductase [Paenisporosarcina sp. TG-14]|uniref:NAD(P)-dependent oxidoreductase n=1 Tax=Paenisporosarcina sp. TG-14 TaxID=1231057 RepID=UPI0002EA086A|nr:NAD(P)-dependent oxidoreductase [Paenisporosarcina sp. TG-14]